MSKFIILFKSLKFTLPFLILSLGFCIFGGHAQELPTKLPQELPTELRQELYALAPTSAPAPIDSAPVVSMDFKDAYLMDVLKAFSIQSGLNFIASQDIEDSKVTVYFDKVSIEEAMDKLFEANNLDYDFYEEERIILVKEAKPEIKTITKLFSLQYAKDITEIIEKILEGQAGKITQDARTNTLIITAMPETFPIIEQTIRKLDVPVPQVMLDVEMLDVSKKLVDKLGLDFSENPLTLILPGGFANKGARFFLGDLSLRGEKLENLEKGSLILGNTYAALLDFLKEQTDTRNLARPRILTLNNETAEIQINSNDAIEKKTERSYPETGPTVETVEFKRPSATERPGVSLTVTPSINEDNVITMVIEPKLITKALSDMSTSDNVIFDLGFRTVKTTVKVRDGETVIIGGLIHRDRSETVEKLPILGDIPIIGALFRNKYHEDTERELIVFITPHIVRDAPVPLMQASNAILPSPEKDTASEESRLLKIEATLDSFNIIQH